MKMLLRLRGGENVQKQLEGAKETKIICEKIKTRLCMFARCFLRICVSAVHSSTRGRTTLLIDTVSTIFSQKACKPGGVVCHANIMHRRASRKGELLTSYLLCEHVTLKQLFFRYVFWIVNCGQPQCMQATDTPPVHTMNLSANRHKFQLRKWTSTWKISSYVFSLPPSLRLSVVKLLPLQTNSRTFSAVSAQRKSLGRGDETHPLMYVNPSLTDLSIANFLACNRDNEKKDTSLMKKLHQRDIIRHTAQVP